MAAANADAVDADAGAGAGVGVDAVDGVDVVDAAAVAVSGFASSQKPVACTDNCRNLQFSIRCLYHARTTRTHTL